MVAWGREGYGVEESADGEDGEEGDEESGEVGAAQRARQREHWKREEG